LMDFGGQLLTQLAGRPHVGDVVLAEDKDKILRLFRVMEGQLKSRKQLFSQAGTASLASYRQASAEKVPAVVLVLDNYLKFSKTYPEAEDLLATIAQEGANLGLYIVLTANSPSIVKQKLALSLPNAVALQL